MLLLALNVLLHHWNLRRADAERAVSLLPGKSMPHPPGGTTFEFLNRLGQGVRRRQDKEQMKVIRRPAGGDQFEALAAGNADQVGMEFVCTGRWDERPAIFRAEDTMDEIARVCVRHLAPSLRPPAVGLAILRRPYGTPIVQRRLATPR